MSEHNPNPRLDAKQIATSKAPALLALALLRDDHIAMRNHVEYLREHLTEWEIIETLAVELTGVFLHTHQGNVDAAERTLQSTLLEISASATE